MQTQSNTSDIEMFVFHPHTVRRLQSLASGVTNNYNIKVKYSNVSTASTDGETIWINPHNRLKVYYDLKQYNLLPQDYDDIKLIWNIFKAGVYHESFHILFTNFDSAKKFINNLQKNEFYVDLFKFINNIIEDRFINDIGRKLFQDAEKCISLYHKCIVSLNNIRSSPQEKTPVSDIINNMIDYTIFNIPITKKNFAFPESYTTFRKIKPLIRRALNQVDFEKRLHYSKKITDIIWEEFNLEDLTQKLQQLLKQLQQQLRTIFDNHNGAKGTPQNQIPVEVLENLLRNGNSISDNEEGEGKEGETQTRGEDTSKKRGSETQEEGVNTKNTGENTSDEDPEQEIIEQIKKEIEEIKQMQKTLNNMSNRYQNVSNRVMYPSVITEQYEIYMSIVNKNLLTINQFKKELQKKLKKEELIDKSFYGININTKKLYDKKRKIFLKKEEQDVKDLNVIILVDGSGSMSDLTEKVVNAVIILFETLSSFANITPYVIYHSALYNTNRIAVFSTKNKFATVSYYPQNNTREDITLNFVRDFIEKLPPKDNLIFIISDGVPYSPSIDVEEMHRNVRNIVKTLKYPIIAIALYDDIYEPLSKLYPNTVLCENLSFLPRKILNAVQKFL